VIRRIGQYDVDAVIGEGGMGTVYRALDARFGRMVAVKVLHAQYQRDPEFVDRFKKEAVLQAQLTHPNIVSVIDFIADESALAMVLEYVNGPSLADLVRETGGPLTEGRALRLMIQVLGALHFAHERLVVHRDVKPANILVVTFDGQEVAKVLDFGIAKITGDDKGRTQAGAKMGTLGYMSPEQIQSPKDTDRRSDVYSAGVVLYELLTGRVPFDADTEYEMMRRIVKEPPQLDGVSGRVGKILARALDKDPERRFQSAGLMRDALVTLMTGAFEAPTPPIASPYESRMWQAVAGAIVVVAIVGAVGTWVFRSGVTDRWFAQPVAPAVVEVVPPAAPAGPIADVPRVVDPPVPAVSEPVPAPPSQAKVGRVVVGTLPWPLESVTVAGRPIRNETTLDAGTYTAEFSAGAGTQLQPIRVTVRIAPGQTLNLGSRVPVGSLQFAVEIGQFTLTLAGRRFTETSNPRVTNLPAGTYTVAITSYDYPPHSDVLTIRSGEETFRRYSHGSGKWITRETR